MNVKHSFEPLLNDLPSHVVLDALVLRQRYASDRYLLASYCPDLVVIPESMDQIQTVLRFSHEHKVPVTVRGSGTGTTGAAIPIQGGIVLSMENLSRILEVDLENGVAVVEPGVITGDLKRSVEKVGLFYPPDPASAELCTIGGNVACNAGGLSSIKYGVTGDYVLGLSGFYADGTPFVLGGKLHKNVAGFDLMSLLIGSEGLLAVITQIVLKLIPHPLVSRSLVVGFSTVEGALASLTDIRQNSALPSAAEVVDGRCILEMRELGNLVLNSAITKFWNEGRAPYYLVLSWDGWDHLQVENELISVVPYLKKPMEIIRALTTQDEEALWQVRRAISEALRSRYPHKVSHDIVVPISQVPFMMSFLKELSYQHNLLILGYGHLGDGNIHVNFLPVSVIEKKTQLAIEKQLFEEVLKCGGSLSGEHGIGLAKQGYMPLMFDEKTLEVMRQLKAAFDPLGLLNPGKVISRFG